jgi:tetratricopeptide (TPR) repeat protein
MPKIQKIRCGFAFGVCLAGTLLVETSYLAASSASLSSDAVRQLEETIFEADLKDLYPLELRIAKILQSEPENPSGTYLMSVLLLKMFTLDPASYSLIRQSTELAAQTFELDRRNELAIASLAAILETSGETSRGLDLIRDAGRKGIKIGWRSNLSKARLMFDGQNGPAVLSVLEEVIQDPDHSSILVAPTLIATITSTYHGDEQIKKLTEWRKKCRSLMMDLAVANAKALAMRYEEANREYTLILKAQPTNSEALLSKGIISLSHKKDVNLAIKLFREAISHTKNENDRIAAETHLALALITHKKDHRESIKASIRAITDAGDREAVLITLLTSFKKNYGVKPTLSFLESLQTDVPGLHLAHALRAELLSEHLGQHMEATRGFTNAITLEPSRSEYYNGRGLAWMGLANLEAALSDFESAVATNPTDAAARYNIACAQARLGMRNAAIESLARAFDLDNRLITHAQSDVDLQSLHNAPEFLALIHKEPRIFSVAH